MAHALLPPPAAVVRRTAMVRSIVVDGAVVHWIETEPRAPGEGHRSLVFSQGGTPHLTAVVTRLVEVASGLQGVWPEPAVLTDLLPAGSIGRTAFWSHRNRKLGGTGTADAG